MVTGKACSNLGRASGGAYHWLFMTPDRLSVAVLGPGGVGGFLAAVLAREGNSVLVLASDDTSRAISHSGLRVESLRFGSFTASIRTAARLSEPVDVFLITVNATQLINPLPPAPPTP